MAHRLWQTQIFDSGSLVRQMQQSGPATILDFIEGADFLQARQGKGRVPDDRGRLGCARR